VLSVLELFTFLLVHIVVYILHVNFIGVMLISILGLRLWGILNINLLGFCR